MKKWILLLLGLIVMSGLQSCDDFTDCIINTRPHLPHKDLDDGFVGNYYQDRVRSEIKNEPRDDAYWYYYTVIGLPAGMNYEFAGRDLFIYGTPQEAGRYSVQVFLEVEPRILVFDQDDGWDEDGDQLCSYTDERFFSLWIQ